MTKTLIIDPGHGGKDGGASGFGVDEKDWNLKMSLYQYIRLKTLGVDVSLTRREDNTLEPVQRVARIKNQYDICLSNHWNAFNGEARGVEGIHSVHGRTDLAADLVNRVVEKTGLPKRRVFKREIKKGVDYYYMHRLTGRTETVILEYGFIDHPADFNYYADNAQFQLVAEAVIEGLCLATGHVYRKPNAGVSVLKPVAPKADPDKKRLVSRHDGKLRFYNKPSWEDKDVFGHVMFGQGFPTVVKKLKVGRGEQYQVKNSKGDIYYITASPAYVNVI